MPRLEVRLFGAPRLLADGQLLRSIPALPLALLAFLAIESRRVHRRAGLAALFWEDATEPVGRHNLRQAIYSIRALAPELQGWLQATRESLALLPHAEVFVDVHRFVACVEAGLPQSRSEAADLYCAPLLQDTAFESGAAFSEWLQSARERLHGLAIHNLDRLVAMHVSRQDWSAAQAAVCRLRDLDGLREATARRSFWIADALGDAVAIEVEWERLKEALRRELGIAPSEETEALYRRLRRAPSPGRAPHAASAAPAEGARPDALLQAARAAERVHAYGYANDLYVRALATLEATSAADAARRCDVLLSRESMLERLGRRAEQRAVLGQLLAAARDSGDPVRLAQALLRDASAAVYAGNGDRALAAASQALQLVRSARDLPGEAEALRELGFVQWQIADYAGALTHGQLALELHRRLGDGSGEASALHNLAEIHCSLGSPQRALQWYAQAVDMHWANGHRIGQILSMVGMANALLQTADASTALAKLVEALDLSERCGERTMQSRALHAIAVHHAASGDLERALHELQRAIEVDRSINYAHGLGHDLVYLGLLHARRSELAQARVALEEALVWFQWSENVGAATETRRYLGELGRAPVPQMAAAREHGVKSHVILPEGKVYCRFQSPIRCDPGVGASS